jgi:hypothetical protein
VAYGGRRTCAVEGWARHTRRTYLDLVAGHRLRDRRSRLGSPAALCASGPGGGSSSTESLSADDQVGRKVGASMSHRPRITVLSAVLAHGTSGMVRPGAPDTKNNGSLDFGPIGASSARVVSAAAGLLYQVTS